METFQYTILLIIMLYTLYMAGLFIRKTGKFKSVACMVAISVFTFNEGLRYGRGIDYNLYGMEYEKLQSGYEFEQDWGMLVIERALVFFDMPWQICVILMSFVFILGVCFLMNNFRTVLPYALPLFVLFSFTKAENMVRWYFGFSFFLIGFSYQLKKAEVKKVSAKFVVLSIVGCIIHTALIPIPILFYLINLKKGIIIKPWYSISIFILIAFFFRTEMMLNFTNIANTLISLSDKYQNYGNIVEDHLVGGYAGAEKNPFPGSGEFALFCVLIYVGYYSIRNMGHVFICAYNLFLIGFLSWPICHQIELASRYNATFFFFGGIVLGTIIYSLWDKKELRYSPILKLLIALIFLNYGRQVLSLPFQNNHPNFYLYIWNKGDKTYDKLYDEWYDFVKYGK